MELARILADRHFELLPSNSFVSRRGVGPLRSSSMPVPRSAGEKILAVLNLDMVAYADLLPRTWRSQQSGFRVAGRTVLLPPPHATLPWDHPRVDASFSRSDHSPFWDQGSAPYADRRTCVGPTPTITRRGHAGYSESRVLTSVAQATLAAAADLAQPVGTRPTFRTSPTAGCDG